MLGDKETAHHHEAGNGATGNPEQGNSPKHSRWLIVEHAFAVIGGISSLVVIAGLGIAGWHHTTTYQRGKEEAMISRLVPGDDYARLVQIVGSVPDSHQRLHSGRQMYVFDRRWEWIELLVSRSDKTLSVGVFAKTTSFKAALAGGAIVNGPPMSAEQLPSVGAFGVCAANYYNYFQGYSYPSAGHSQSVVFGITPATDEDQAETGNQLCAALDAKPACYKRLRGPLSHGVPMLGTRFLNCMMSVPAWLSLQRHIPPGLVIQTAPFQHIIPDMLSVDPYLENGN